jgi:hypothetical protein
VVLVQQVVEVEVVVLLVVLVVVVVVPHVPGAVTPGEQAVDGGMHTHGELHPPELSDQTQAPPPSGWPNQVHAPQLVVVLVVVELVEVVVVLVVEVVVVLVFWQGVSAVSLAWLPLYGGFWAQVQDVPHLEQSSVQVARGTDQTHRHVSTQPVPVVGVVQLVVVVGAAVVVVPVPEVPVVVLVLLVVVLWQAVLVTLPQVGAGALGTSQIHPSVAVSEQP